MQGLLFGCGVGWGGVGCAGKKVSCRVCGTVCFFVGSDGAYNRNRRFPTLASFVRGPVGLLLALNTKLRN